MSYARSRSLPGDVVLHLERLHALLHIHTEAPTPSAAASEDQATNRATPGSGQEAKASPSDGGAQQGIVRSGGAPPREAVTGMMIYLVLERASLLAEGGYVLQAAVEVLDALDERNALRPWFAAGESETRLLQVPSTARRDEAGAECEGAGSGAGYENNGQIPEVRDGV